MTKSELPVLIVTARERPTHGYELGQLLYDSLEERMYKLRARNPHFWGPTDSSFYMKTGKCEFMGGTLRGEGIMGEMVSLGTFSGNSMDANGTNQSFSTGTGSAINAGVAIRPTIGSDFQGFTRTSWTPMYRIKYIISARSGADLRHYSGWIKNATGPTVGDDPLPQAEGGIVVGFNSTDTTWQVWHGDGVAAITKDPLASIPVSASITQYRVEMIFTTSTNVTVNVYNGSDVLLQSLAVTSNVLAFGKSINWAHVVQNATTTPTKVMTGLKAEMRTTL